MGISQETHGFFASTKSIVLLQEHHVSVHSVSDSEFV